VGLRIRRDGRLYGWHPEAHRYYYSRTSGGIPAALYERYLSESLITAKSKKTTKEEAEASSFVIFIRPIVRLQE